MTPGSAARLLASTLIKAGMSLACAESCTGGLAAAKLTGRAGASKYFMGCVVSYSNSAKCRLLGVPTDIMENFGAVSKETAIAMAKGALRAFCSDCAFSITGIAGPDGGLPGKPVGSVWFGFAIRGAVSAEFHLFEGNRTKIRDDATIWAFNHLTHLIRGTNELDNPLEAGVSLR
jgi:PncC family amidohydrolase